MKRLAAALVLVLVLVGAFIQREATKPGYLALGSTADAQTWLVDDPDAAYHLRRVQLALASGEVSDTDRYLNHPTGSPIPWPPFADGLFGLVAKLTTDGDGTSAERVELGGYDENQVEAVLVHLPPFLGALTCLAIFGAVWVLSERGRSRVWCAVFGAWIYAAFPIAVWYGGVTRLDHHVVIALLLALHLMFITLSLRAEKSIDALSFGLAAGLVAGMAIATWLASGIFVGIAGIAYFLRAAGPDEERSLFGARAALLYFAAAAGVTLFPASDSAWNALQPGSLINLTSGVPRALGCALIPFAVIAFLRSRKGGTTNSRYLAASLGVVVLAATLYLLPGFLEGVREGFRWASRENLFMDVVAESRPLDSADLIFGKLSYLALLFPIAWLYLLPTSLRSAERAHLCLLALAMAVMAIGQQRFGNTLAIPFACTLALAFNQAARQFAESRGRTLVLAGMGAASLALLPSVLSVFETTDDEYRDLAEWRGEVIGGLRWMRTNTPSPGPWNAPHHPQDYGVLSSWGLGHLIEYHARRPSITTNFGSFVGERNFREAAAALAETDPQEFLRRVRELGADYVVVTPRLVQDLGSTLRIAGQDPALLFQRDASGKKLYGPRATQSALWRLALHNEAVGSKHVFGTQLVWASKRFETPSGGLPRPGAPFGPVLSIYRLTDGRALNRSPSLESGR